MQLMKISIYGSNQGNPAWLAVANTEWSALRMRSPALSSRASDEWRARSTNKKLLFLPNHTLDKHCS